MKKNLLYLFLLAALAVAVWYFVFRNGNSTIPVNEKNFAVEDTANIGKIFIADMNKKSVTLERDENGGWTVNGMYAVRPDAISLLLKTIKQLSIKNPVSEAARNSVLKNMATDNHKVEIYDLKNQLIVSYYVGGGTNDFNGTYMKTANGENPFVVSVPGFHGVLTVRYITDVEELRSRSIFSLPFNQLSEVKVLYPADEANSFVIEVAGVDSFRLFSYVSHTLISPKKIEKEKVGMYLSLFRFINAEGFENNNTLKDSVLAQTPYCEISVKDIHRKISQAICYYKPITKTSLQQFSQNGEALPHDIDHFYALINDRKDFVLIQQFHFGRLFQKINFFSRISSSGK